jgi:coenzyme F420-0:L-glutamate ligase
MRSSAARHQSARAAGEVRILPVAVSGEIHAGESLGARLLAATHSLGLRFQDGDILVVKHKVVSKSEGAMIALDTIRPSAASRIWARRYGLDARVSELAKRESRRIVRRKRGVMITETTHGFICANSGVDVSNVDGGQHAVLLPSDPDRSAMKLRRELKKQLGIEVAVIVSDSFGRPWREGLTEVANAAFGRLSRAPRSTRLFAARHRGGRGGRTGVCGRSGMQQAGEHSSLHHSRLFVSSRKAPRQPRGAGTDSAGEERSFSVRVRR